MNSLASIILRWSYCGAVFQLCSTLCDPMDTACQVPLSFWRLLRFMSIESVMLSNHLILCHLLLFLLSIFPSIRVFSSVLALHIRCPKYWNFIFTSVLPMHIQSPFPLGWTGWISVQSKGLSRVFSNTTVQSINSSALSLLHSPTLTSIHDQRKNHSLD